MHLALDAVQLLHALLSSRIEVPNRSVQLGGKHGGRYSRICTAARTGGSADGGRLMPSNAGPVSLHYTDNSRYCRGGVLDYSSTVSSFFLLYSAGSACITSLPSTEHTAIFSRGPHLLYGGRYDVGTFHAVLDFWTIFKRHVGVCVLSWATALPWTRRTTAAFAAAPAARLKPMLRNTGNTPPPLAHPPGFQSLVRHTFGGCIPFDSKVPKRLHQQLAINSKRKRVGIRTKKRRDKKTCVPRYVRTST